MTLPRPLATRLRHALVTRLRAQGKLAFLQSLPPGARVLDVGCGNRSPRDAKILRPDLVYHGLDVADYNQGDASIAYADSYVVVPPEEFAAALARYEGQMDAVVSSHNIEHCIDPGAVVRGMARALRPGGRLFLAFPCEESVDFPSRKGTLNFFDDPTHREVPSWTTVLEQLRGSGLAIELTCRRYRPRLLFTIGWLLEPLGRLASRNVPGSATWALYGFESIIWAHRHPHATP